MKNCLFCDQYINYRNTVCREHIDLYLLYKDAYWFRELVKMESTQTRINSKECGVLSNTIPYTHVIPQVKDLKDDLKSRQSKIITLWNENKSIKEIAQDVSMNYHAVYMFLKRKGYLTI